MPEQAEWQSDSGDYTWRPEYIRQATKGLATGKPAFAYDLRTLGERVTALEAELSRLRALLLMAECDL